MGRSIMVAVYEKDFTYSFEHFPHLSKMAPSTPSPPVCLRLVKGRKEGEKYRTRAED